MDPAFDLVIRGGSSSTGPAAEPFEADVAVKDGRIAAVGKVAGAGAEEIDAKGKHRHARLRRHPHPLRRPGDLGERLQPSSWHGVTTVVMGNCGVGFAPCRPERPRPADRLMEGVEDIPFPVLTEGLPWNWETFPDYLDALGGAAFDIDIGSQLPHAALRVFVMGERGADREPATDGRHRRDGRASPAGDGGRRARLSTSRTLNHRTSDGSPIATLTAGEDELTGIAMGIAAAGAGRLQVVSDFADPEAEFAMLRRIVERSGRPLSFSLVQSPIRPDNYMTLLDAVEDAVAAGLRSRRRSRRGRWACCFGLELTLNPFSHYPVYKRDRQAPAGRARRAAEDPEFRERLLADPARGRGARTHAATGPHAPDGRPPDYEPQPSDLGRRHRRAPRRRRRRRWRWTTC